MGDDGADHATTLIPDEAHESSESGSMLCWRTLPDEGRLEREKALENELLSHDFFFMDGERTVEHADGMASSLDNVSGRPKLVDSEAELETESSEPWRVRGR